MRNCESCGREDAKLFAYWPAVLCPICVQQRVEMHDAETELTADNVPAPVAGETSEKSLRLSELKAEAADQLSRFGEALGLQVALIRWHLNGGNVVAARTQAIALLESYIRTAHTAATGKAKTGKSIGRQIASLRNSDRIDDATMAQFVHAFDRVAHSDVTHECVVSDVIQAIECIVLVRQFRQPSEA